MEDKGVSTGVKYWNFELSPILEHSDSEDTEIRLLPFLSILNDLHNNTKGNKRIASFLQKVKPAYKTYGHSYYQELLQEMKSGILQNIENGLSDFDFSRTKIFGISAKYNQWIPGMILAGAVKKIAPHIKVVVGGFGNSNAAHEAMKICPYFDMATWGEGEYPLWQFYQELEKEKPDYAIIPRFMYRNGDELIKSATSKSEYLDFNNYLYPDFSDYTTQHPHQDDMDKVNIPINSIRSCNWGKCKFCDFNTGYKLRMRTPECIVAEIEYIYNTYGFSTFSFVDSDTFGNKEHFNKLLNLIIDLKLRTAEDLEFWAEIIPNPEIDAAMIERMAIAGFKNLFIGYDGLSDVLLQKMNKKSSFSDNLFFVKESLKQGIYPYVNVIKHIPYETEEDAQECIDNLHFTRFFYNDAVISFEHNFVNLVLSSMSKYYRMLSVEERNTYNYDILTYLLPDYFHGDENRFHLFRYEKNIPENIKEWDKLQEIENYYKENCFTYKTQEHNGVVYYTEYCNDEEIENIVFDGPEYGLVLKATQNQVTSFANLQLHVNASLPHISKERLVEVLSHLKQAHILYYNEEYSNIVSLVRL